ncbi:MAG: glycerophosphodiester phosphodiesterase [Promethearchaeota archaeon]
MSKIEWWRSGKTMCMAHRGTSSSIPENTLEAFQDAASLKGVDVIETDTHLTRDGCFVLFHDARLGRTTNGRGRIADWTLDDLKVLDAGYKFKGENGDFPFRGKGFKIHSISDILPRFPQMKFNLDIKSRDPRAPALLARKLKDLGVQDRVMVGSFWQKQIIRFRTAAGGEIPTSASIGEVFRFRKKAYNYLKRNTGRDVPQELDPEAFFGSPLPYHALQVPMAISFIKVIKNAEFISFAHALGIAVHVWTINREDVMQQLLKWRVDGIFTDNPSLLINNINKVI